MENSPALLFRGIDFVLRDLAALGYAAEWEVLSACSFGAPHTRERLFIVAHPHAEHGVSGMGPLSHGAATLQRRNGGASEGVRRSAWLETLAPHVGGVDGIPDPLDRAAALGNAVVPVVAEMIGAGIMAHAAAHAAATLV